MWLVALCGAGAGCLRGRRTGPAASDDPAPAGAGAAAEYFTDVALVNQYGQTMRLYTDLIKGRTILVVPFFTSCASACPVIQRTLATLQTRLGDRLGRDIVIVSLTVDPARDTVERLRTYAEGASARPGWFFLGGSPANVELANLNPTDMAPNPEDFAQGVESLTLLKAALDLVPMPRRKAIIMRDIEGLEMADIARKLSISRFGVYTRLFRGRGELADALRALSRNELPP